jgi:hypothetical protein
MRARSVAIEPGGEAIFELRRELEGVCRSVGDRRMTGKTVSGVYSR